MCVCVCVCVSVSVVVVRAARKTRMPKSVLGFGSYFRAAKYQHSVLFFFFYLNILFFYKKI